MLFLFQYYFNKFLLALLDKDLAVAEHFLSHIQLDIGDLLAVDGKSALLDGTSAFTVARNQAQLLDQVDQAFAFALEF